MEYSIAIFEMQRGKFKSNLSPWKGEGENTCQPNEADAAWSQTSHIAYTPTLEVSRGALLPKNLGQAHESQHLLHPGLDVRIVGKA